MADKSKMTWQKSWLPRERRMPKVMRRRGRGGICFQRTGSAEPAPSVEAAPAAEKPAAPRRSKETRRRKAERC